jgi:hypothetical protein
VRYSRPFTNSKARRSLGEEALAVLTPEQVAKHRYFRAIRDKYVAHSENDFEDSRPIARFLQDRVREEGIEQIQCNHNRVLVLSQDDIDAIIELTTLLLGHVESRLEEEKKKVLAVVRAIPLDEILGDSQRPLAGTDLDPSKTRRPY